MPKQYTYAAARIHTKENSMLSMQDMERLLAASSFDEAVSLLAEEGYDTADAKNTDEILRREHNKTNKLVSELITDMSALDIFFYKNDFHNLKAAVKSQMTADEGKCIFVSSGTVPKEIIASAVKNRELGKLPEFLKVPAQKALESLLKTNNGSLCDTIIDKAYFETLIKTGEASDNLTISRFAELSVALANIRIAARGSRLGKSQDFFKRSFVKCKTVSAESLAIAASKGISELEEYLVSTDYSNGAEALKNSDAAFEKWCDDRIMAELCKEKYRNFTIAPIAVYILARETELKTVGLILTAKQNNLETSVIRERLRELYV